MEWETRADCAQRDPKLWDGEYEYETQKAKQICFRCPVIDHCLIDAMVNKEPWTVRGAHTAEERDAIRPAWERKHAKNLNLLKSVYKRENLLLGPRQEERLEKCRKAKAALHPGMQDYTDHIAVLNQVIAHPGETTENLAKRMGMSRSWFQHALISAWRMAS